MRHALPPAAILLAAGQGLRWRAAGGWADTDKLLQALPDGRPVAVAAAQALHAAGLPMLAVVRPGREALRAALEAAGAQVVVAPEAVGGMGHSIAAGVRAAAGAGGWLVMPADMPAVRPATIAAVAAAIADPQTLAAPAWDGHRGHPVGFGSAYGGELLALSGDTGARGILQRHAAALRLLDCGDPGVLQDVDTPADLRR